MLQRYILNLSCLALCVSSVHGQILTVKSGATGKPLEFVTVHTPDSQIFKVTDARGRADLGAFDIDALVEIRYVGYSTEVLSVAEIGRRGYIVLLKPESIFIDQVVISATRWKQKRGDVPSRISIITSGEVTLQNPQTAADMLEGSGEVFIQKSQLGGGSPMIRGFSANRLLYAVDGIRMNSAIFRSGNLQNVISLDPFAIENTEVLFGPGSVIYGSDAIGGVMGFHTLTPVLALDDASEVSGSAALRYASANAEQTAHFDLNLGWKRWAAVTSLTHFRFGDLRMGRHGPDEYLRPFYVDRHNDADIVVANSDPHVQRPTGYGQTNLMQKIRFKPDAHWDLTYAMHYSATTNFPRYDRHILLRDGIPRSAEWEYGPQIWMMHHMQITHQRPSRFYDDLAIRLAYQHFKESRFDRNLNQPMRRIREEHVDAYSLNIDFAKTLSAVHHLTYGAEAVINEVFSDGVDEHIVEKTSQPGPARYPRSTWASYAAYLTHAWRPQERLTLQSGIRYSRFGLRSTFDTQFYPFPFERASINHGALTGSAGLVWRAGHQWVLHMNLATGFRAPNVDDTGKVFDSQPGSVVVPNPALKAEYAYNAEAGFSKVFGKALRVECTAFYTILENAMVRRNFTLNGQDSIFYAGELSAVQALQNVARATVYGVQAGMEIRLPGGFSLLSRYNLQRGDEELDDGRTSPSRHAAPAFGSTHLRFITDRVTFEVSARYSAQVPFTRLADEERGKAYLYAIDAGGNPYSPSWYTLNMRVSVEASKNLTFTAGVENITDIRYRTYSSGIAAAGRNVVLAVRGKW